jgi:hypothetical protein
VTGFLIASSRSKARFDQKLNFTQIAKSSQDAAVAGWVQPGYEQAAGLYECALEIHRRRTPSGVPCL